MTDLSTSMFSYRAWLVDLDGTLYVPTPVKLAMAVDLATFGWRDMALIRRFRREHERIRDETTARKNDSAFDEPPSAFERQIHRTAVASGRRTDAVRQVVTRWMIDRPSRWLRVFRRRSLIRQIARFRAAGGRTAIVSDYPAAAKLRSLGCESLFDAIVANGEPDGPLRLKPQPEGIQIALERLGVLAEESLMIGDRCDTDGLAASAAGVSFRRIGAQRIVRAHAQCKLAKNVSKTD